MDKKKILFFCKHNSCRSQMAEAYMKHFGKDQFEVHSAGLTPEPIHPLVEEVLQLDGVSLEGQTSKSIELYLGKVQFDYVVIVCQEGEAECPKLYPMAMNVERWSLRDPADVVGEKDAAEAFRRTADDIKNRVQNLLANH